jgi:hypothetical protein
MGCAGLRKPVVLSGMDKALKRIFMYSNLDFILGYSIENVYVEEKEEACVALTEIARNTG